MATPDTLRAALVDELVRSGVVRSPVVEAALRDVPRHLFLPREPLPRAYADEAVTTQVRDGVPTSSASQPSMVAIMLEQLAVRPGDRVLEIGAGTGYNAALLARLVGSEGAVVSVDVDPELVESAAAHLRAAGTTGVDLRCADGALGCPDAAPFDRIVLTVGSDDVRREWTTQLTPDGRLLLPLGFGPVQLCVALDRGPDGVLRSASVRPCRFIRLRGSVAGEVARTPLPDGRVAVHGSRFDAASLATLAEDERERLTLGPEPVSKDNPERLVLWLSLVEPAVLQLLGDPDTPAEAVAVALAGPDGIAELCPDHRTVRTYGPGGAALAERLRADLAEWAAVGRPGAAALRVAVLPPASPVPARPGSRVFDTPSARLVVSAG